MSALALSPDLQARKRQFHENLANYLKRAPLAELAELVGALSAELVTVRGIQVAEPLGLVEARLEYVAECAR